MTGTQLLNENQIVNENRKTESRFEQYSRQSSSSLEELEEQYFTLQEDMKSRLQPATERQTPSPQSRSAIQIHDAATSQPKPAWVTAMRVLIEQKGLDVRGLDLRGISDVADCFVIASGTSERHVKGMADKVEAALAPLGETPSSAGGYENGEWVLMDYGDLVVHLFYEPIRQYYEFDALWAKALPLPLEPELEAQARKLRTGMFF